MTTNRFCPFMKVLVRNYTENVWKPDIFLYYEDGMEWPYICANRNWKYCVPYEGNEHLAFTTDSTYSPELGDIVRYRIHGNKTFIGIIHKIDGTLITVVPIHEDHLCIIHIDIKDILHKIDQ